MFTGIITDLGRLGTLDRRGPNARLVVETAYDTATIALGASIACSGPCLTVVERGPGSFAVDASAETLSRTTIGTWQPGQAINLERPLRLGDELGGHLVSGHIDGVATLIGQDREGDGLKLTIEAPADLARFVAAKGSVALDGVSLTVNWVDGARFGVMIIPHTQQATTLDRMRQGAVMNIEIDLLARYLQRLMVKE